MASAKRVAAVVVALSGCVDSRPSPTAGQVSSLQLDLIDPPPDSLGSPSAPVQARQATFNVTALDEHNQPYTGDLDVDVFISFGGVKTGLSSNCGSDDSGNVPITTLHLTGGQISNQSVALPSAFGASIVWLDEPKSHATGASPTIYFRNPHVADVQTPPDLTAPNATFCSPFNGKFVVIDQATGSGQLVVSSVFGDAFAITDTGATIFNSVYLYSFGKPPSYIVEGKVLSSFSGNVSKFVGFTELNFPLFTTADNVPLAPVPSPVPLDQATLVARDNVALLQYDAGLVQFTGTICDPDPPNPNNDSNIQRTKDSWVKFNQFVLDGDGTCASISNFSVELPGKVLGTFDPLQAKTHMATIAGMLRNNSGQNLLLDANGQPIACNGTDMPCVTGSCVEGQCKKGAFNFWTIVPRHPEDVTVQ